MKRGDNDSEARRRSAAAAGALFLFVALVWSVRGEAASVRYHGFQLDESHRLILEEEDGWVRIGILTRTRTEGGAPLATPLPEPGSTEQGSGGRYMEADYVAKVYAEVVVPAAPNYFQNPGQLYHVIVQGLSVCPDYVSEFRADAETVRDRITAQLFGLSERTSDIQRRALQEGQGLVLEILKEAGRLPAYISPSVRMSKSGQFRITPGTRQRRTVTPLQTFAPKVQLNKPEMGAAKRAQDKASLPKGATSPAATRGFETPAFAPKTAATAGKVKQAGPPIPEVSSTAVPPAGQGSPTAPGLVPRPDLVQPHRGSVQAVDDQRVLDQQTLDKSWNATGAEAPWKTDQRVQKTP